MSDDNKIVDAEFKLREDQMENIEQMLHNKAKCVTDEDIKKIHNEMDEKLRKVKGGSNVVVKFIKRAKLLYDMLLDKEFKLEWSSKAVIIAALLYFISPIDVLPDFIPGIGYIDDAFMLVIVYNTLENEIKKFITLKNLFMEEYF